MAIKPISEKYTVLRCFSRLCEYMYKKGVRDSAELYSYELSEQFLRENDPKNDFRFIFDEDGKKLRREFYCAICSMFLIKIRARKGAIILDGSKVGKQMQEGAAALVNVYYHKGVRDGIGIEIAKAIDFFHEDEKFNKHVKLSGEVLTMMDFIEDMRMEALRLDSEDFPAGFKIWKFTCDGLLEYYIRKQNY